MELVRSPTVTDERPTTRVVWIRTLSIVSKEELQKMQGKSQLQKSVITSKDLP